MDEPDMIAVCSRCLRPVPCEDNCARCGAHVWRKFPSLALASVRRLAAKGWVVACCKAETDTVSVLRVQFQWMAPPVTHNPQIVTAFEMKMEVRGPARPDVLARHPTSIVEAARYLSEWSKKAPRLTLPFSQKLCDLCRPQGADWLFSRCRCPITGTFVEFHKGLPDRCAYAAEQVVTSPVRLQQVMGTYAGHVLSQRALRRSV